jgi:hypothetical protein
MSTSASRLNCADGRLSTGLFKTNNSFFHKTETIYSGRLAGASPAAIDYTPLHPPGAQSIFGKYHKLIPSLGYHGIMSR